VANGEPAQNLLSTKFMDLNWSDWEFESVGGTKREHYFFDYLKESYCIYNESWYSLIIETRNTAMTLRQMNIEWKHVKSYATEKALMKRIDEDKEMYPEHDDRFIVMMTPEGRWTAVVVLDKTTGGYVGRYAGFLKV
jgi:hypothetical protein